MFSARTASTLLTFTLAGALAPADGLEAAPRASAPSVVRPSATSARVAAPRADRTAPSIAAPARGLIMVSDFEGRVRFMDPATRSIVYDYNYSREPSESCSNPRVTCSVIGASHVVHNDEDYLDTATWVFNRRAGQSNVDKYYSVIQRVRTTTPAQVVWKIKDLDFTKIADSDAYCTQDPANPAAHQDSRCRPRLTHSIQVLNDHPDQKVVSAVFADMSNSRIVQATLDYSAGSTLAKVDWVLNSTNPDWPDGALPNAAQVVSQPDATYLLTTFYSTDEQYHGSRLIMWKWMNGEWVAQWRFPEVVADGPALLNTPHMGEVLIDPVTEEPMVFYSHSRGTAGSWDTFEDYGGSFGLLRLGDTLSDDPTYIMDAVVRGTDPALETKFSRDVDFLPDGSMLLTDAACESGECYNPSRLFHVLPFFEDAQPNTKPGYYSPDEAFINRYNVPDELVLEEFQCGFGVLFESEWIQPEKVGRTLRSAATRPVGTCPAPI